MASRAVWIGGLAAGALAVGVGVYVVTRKPAALTPPKPTDAVKAPPSAPIQTPQATQTFQAQQQPPPGREVIVTPGSSTEYVATGAYLTLSLPVGGTWAGIILVDQATKSQATELLAPTVKSSNSMSFPASEVIGQIVWCAWDMNGVHNETYVTVLQQKVIPLH